jgi:hypothetical protein
MEFGCRTLKDKESQRKILVTSKGDYSLARNNEMALEKNYDFQKCRCVWKGK